MDTAFLRQIEGFSLTTAEILYRLPDHPKLSAELYLAGLRPRATLPQAHRLPRFLGRQSRRRAVPHSRGASAADRAGGVQLRRGRAQAALIARECRRSATRVAIQPSCGKLRDFRRDERWAMWRWLAVFLFGGVLGAAFGVALGFFLFPYVFPPPEAKEQLTQAEARQARRQGRVHPAPIRTTRSIMARARSASMRGRCSSARTSRWAPVPTSTSISCRRPIFASSSARGRHDVRGPWALARLQGEPEISGPRRRRPRQVSERGDLVPAVFGADLARRSHLRAEFLSRSLRRADRGSLEGGLGFVPELVDMRLLALEHRLQRAERLRIEIEGHAREQVMDQVEVLEHVEPVHDGLHDLALHPEHVGVAIALMHLVRLMGEIGEEIDDQRRGEDVREDPQHQHLAPIAVHRQRQARSRRRARASPRCGG